MYYQFFYKHSVLSNFVLKLCQSVDNDLKLFLMICDRFTIHCM